MNEELFENQEVSATEAVPEEKEPIAAPTENANEGNGDAESENKTVEIVGVRFRTSGKIYYFDPRGFSCKVGDAVVVETSRGVEFGHVTVANRQVSEQEIVSPLRPLIRMATEEDRAHAEKNKLREIDAYNVCVEKIAVHKLEMKLVDVEYAFDNSRLLFYFTADGRVDFRELVKDLAGVFRTRIELRQIGIRDEAKLLGGLGICGRPFCCHSFLSDFVQVSIKMAKEQNLSLNSAKISGACGRLMCCLRYESETYEEEIARTPRVDALVKTVDGDGIVTENSPLAGWVKVRLAKFPEEAPRVFHRDDVTVLRPSGGKEAFEGMVAEEARITAEKKAEKEAARRPRSATLEPTAKKEHTAPEEKKPRVQSQQRRPQQNRPAQSQGQKNNVPNGSAPVQNEHPPRPRNQNNNRRRRSHNRPAGEGKKAQEKNN